MVTVSSSLKPLREEAADCRAYPLWKNATQTVFDEGPQHAQAMLVGEQPDDKEDLGGKPFVGPVGKMLDRTLEEAASTARKSTWVPALRCTAEEALHRVRDTQHHAAAARLTAASASEVKVWSVFFSSCSVSSSNRTASFMPSCWAHCLSVP